MIVLKDFFGQIKACCEFWLVNKDGTRNPAGEYVWVHHIETSDGIEGQEVIREIIDEIAESCPTAIGAYWQREKTGELPHLFVRNRLVRRDVNATV